MDQVKLILKYLQKYHFWLLSVIAMIVAVAGWMSASRALTSAFTGEKMAILGKFKELTDIQTGGNPPNGQWKEGISKLTDEERKKVKSAWELVYSQQKDLLRWPNELGPDFLKFINSNPQTAEIPPPLRETYLNTIKGEFPKLLAIIGADAAGPKTSPGGPTASGSSPASAPKPPTDAGPRPKVEWSTDVQTQIQKQLDFPVTPSSPEIRLTQEDLWVYAALLNIVHKVNEGKYVAPLRKITSMKIGKAAASDYERGMEGGHIYRIQAAGGGGEAAPPPGPAPAAAPAGEGAGPALDEGRYVDADGKPLGAGATANDPFKRMPVSLKVVIDQRQINKLLVECANSPLPVDVKQFRVNPNSKKSEGSHGGAPQNQGGPKTATAMSDSFDVNVELEGIIYIFNPPDPTKLGGADASATAGAPGAAPTGG